MGIGKKILTVTLSIVLVILLFILGILWSSQIFLYPEVYKNAFEENNFYDSVELSQIPGGEFIVLPEEGMKGIVDTMLEGFLSYMRGDSEKLNMTLEVDVERLDSFLLTESQKIRICNLGEEPFSGKIPKCRPPEVNVSEYLNEILEKNNFTVPESKRINVAEVLGLDVEGISKLRPYTVAYLYILYGLAIFILAISVLIFFISETRTRWTGVDFLVSGALIFFMGALAFPPIIQALSSGIGFIEPIATNMLNVLYSRLTAYSILIGIIGAITLTLSFFINKEKK